MAHRYRELLPQRGHPRMRRPIGTRTAGLVTALMAAAGLAGFAPSASASASASATGTATAAATGPHRTAVTAPHRATSPQRLTANAATAVSGALLYHGGAVQTAPKVYLDFWGWGNDPNGEQNYLIKFLSSVGATPWLNTMNLYSGGSSGDLLAGVWADPSSAPSQPTDADIQQEALAAQDEMNIPNTVNSQVVVALPPGHDPAGFKTSWCAYHDNLSSSNVAYTALPYMTDAGSTCGENAVNSGSAGVLDGVSIVEGHELAETITDPQLNAWYDAGGEEIGDKCAWTDLRNITTSSGTFAVQPMWSNATSSCVTAAPQWTDWANEIGAPPPGVAPGTAPDVATGGVNRLDVYVRGNDNAVWTETWNGSGWSGWQSLGGDTVSNPTAVENGPNPIDLFAVGSNGDIWHRTFSAGTWYGWADELPPPPAGIAAGASPSVTTSPNRMDVYVRGNDNAVWDDFWNGTGWSGWQSLGGGVVSNPAAVAGGPSPIDLFAVGSNGDIWQRAYNGGGWQAWNDAVSAPPPGLAPGASPSAATFGGNRVDLFVRGNDDAIWHTFWNGVGWSSWQSLGPIIVADPGAVGGGPNIFDLFGIGTDGSVWHKYYTNPS